MTLELIDLLHKHGLHSTAKWLWIQRNLQRAIASDRKAGVGVNEPVRVNLTWVCNKTTIVINQMTIVLGHCETQLLHRGKTRYGANPIERKCTMAPKSNTAKKETETTHPEGWNKVDGIVPESLNTTQTANEGATPETGNPWDETTGETDKGTQTAATAVAEAPKVLPDTSLQREYMAEVEAAKTAGTEIPPPPASLRKSNLPFWFEHTDEPDTDIKAFISGAMRNANRAEKEKETLFSILVLGLAEEFALNSDKYKVETGPKNVDILTKEGDKKAREFIKDCLGYDPSKDGSTYDSGGKNTTLEQYIPPAVQAAWLLFKGQFGILPGFYDNKSVYVHTAEDAEQEDYDAFLKRMVNKARCIVVPSNMAYPHLKVNTSGAKGKPKMVRNPETYYVRASQPVLRSMARYIFDGLDRTPDGTSNERGTDENRPETVSEARETITKAAAAIDAADDNAKESDFEYLIGTCQEMLKSKKMVEVIAKSEKLKEYLFDLRMTLDAVIDEDGEIVIPTK